MLRKILPFAAALVFLTSLQNAQAAENGFFSSDKTQPAGAAPTLADLETAENAIANLWSQLPYTARHVMFVSHKAELYGGYEQRPSNVFIQGEKLLTYLEPVGYGWKPLDAGMFTFGVTTDFEILTPSGKVLAGQRAFQKVDLASHYKNREFFVSLTLTIDGIEPGDYVLAYTLHDNVSGKSTRVEQPFTIKVSG